MHLVVVVKYFIDNLYLNINTISDNEKRIFSPPLPEDITSFYVKILSSLYTFVIILTVSTLSQ